MNRTKLIQLVHIGAAKKFSDDDERKCWQQKCTGHRSCSAMTTNQLNSLVSELQTEGFLTAARQSGQSRKPTATARLIYHLWNCLTKSGITNKDGLSQWLQNYTKSDNGVGYTKPEFLPFSVSNKVIEQLKKWAARENVSWK